jgi:pimeloyl-ACP methyl ester carboxylesterase
MLGDLWRLQADVLLARTELASHLLSQRVLESVAPRVGGRRPVVLLPGFLGSGASLGRLRKFLCVSGFDAHGWGAGRNLGPRDQDMESHLQRLQIQIGDKVRQLADRHSAPVALVGQSLGGVYARELATRLAPDIDRVIMLGSPAFHPYLKKRHNGLVGLLGYGITRQTQARIAGRWGLLHWHADEPELPCVAICSPIDGIVDETSAAIPRYVVQRSGARAPRENIRVVSSHIGMGVNPFVLLAVADRLAQSRDAWHGFDPQRYFPTFLHWAVSRVYPERL